MAEPERLLTTRGLEVRAGDRTVCARLDLAVRTGECWGVLGPNGAGKTSLLHTLAGLRAARAGEIRWRERPLEQWRRRELARVVGLLFQQPEPGFPSSVRETVLAGRHPHLGRWAWESAGDLATADAALEEAGLAGLEDRALDRLSGGERRRVEIATLLAQDPLCALLDEPGNHLDLPTELRLLDLLRRRFTRPGRAVMMVMHDPGLALRHATHLLLLHGDGRWQAGPAGELGRAECLSELYGHDLVRLEGPRGPVFAPR